jgi:tetratricopeptide (TPR) repeat protein
LFRFGCRSLTAATLAALALWAGPAAAQDATRARQAEIFAQLRDAPDDPALASEYIRVSLALGDVEAAISTLERALMFRPGDADLMVELGAAYFRLGSYGVAESYFTQARAAGVSAATDARIDEFLEAIAARSARSRFSGVAMAGLAASTNANLGVDDRIVRFFGVPLPVDEDFEAQSDVGFRIVASVDHAYDLGRANLDAWRTDASLYSIRFAEQEQGDIDSFALSTGPSLSLTDTAFGPQARPFVGVRFTRAADAPFYNEAGAGFELSDSFSPRWNGFVRFGGGWRDYRGRRGEGYDGAVARGVGGVSYAAAPGTTLYAAALADAEFADEDFNSSVEVGLRLAAQRDYDPGFGRDLGLWTVTGYLQAARRDFDAPDPEVDGDVTRSDDELRLGVAHLFRLGGGLGLQLDLDAFRQDSNIQNYDLDALSGAVSAVLEF